MCQTSRLLLRAQKQAAMVTALWKEKYFLVSRWSSQGCRGECCSTHAVLIVDQFGTDKPKLTYSIFYFGIRFFRATLTSSVSFPPPRIIRALCLTNSSLMQRCRTLVMSQVSPTLFLVYLIVMMLSYKFVTRHWLTFHSMCGVDLLWTLFQARYLLHGGMGRTIQCKHVTNLLSNFLQGTV